MPFLRSKTIVASGAAAPLALRAGQAFQINLQVVDPDNLDANGVPLAVDLTGGAVIFSMRALDADGDPTGSALISRQATITNEVGGLCYIPLTEGDTINLAVDSYCYDCIFIDSSGNPTPVVALSAFVITGANGHSGQTVTVPPSQSPLAQGPKGDPGSSAGDAAENKDPTQSVDGLLAVNDKAKINRIISPLDWGAVFRVVNTTGTGSSGQNIITLASTDYLRIGVNGGCWLGIQGAGASGVPLLAQVTAVLSGNRVQLDRNLATSVTNEAVSVDDRPAIQNALDYLESNGGGTLECPAGIAIIGTPGAAAINTPAFHGSNTAIRGKAKGATTWRVCNNALQTPPHATSYPTACVLMNKGNLWWAAGAVTVSPLPGMDTHLDLDDITIDANRGNQPATMSADGGYGPGKVIPTPFGFQLASVSGSLTSGTYTIYASWLNAAGETAIIGGAAATYAQLAMDGSHAIQVTLPPKPANATQVVLYIRNSIDANDPNNLDLYCERRVISYPGGGVYTITSHTAGTSIPPDQFVTTLTESTGSMGIWYDNCSDVNIGEGVEVINAQLDGIGLGWAGQDLGASTGAYNVRIGATVRNCTRTATALLGSVDSIDYKSFVAEYCTNGCDMEPAFAAILGHVTFDLCKFRYSFLGTGITLNAQRLAYGSPSPTKNVRISRSNFYWNKQHASIGAIEELELLGNHFYQSFTTGVVIADSSPTGNGIITSNKFIECGSVPPGYTQYFPSAQSADGLLLENCKGYTLDDNRFRMNANFSGGLAFTGCVDCSIPQIEFDDNPNVQTANSILAGITFDQSDGHLRNSIGMVKGRVSVVSNNVVVTYGRTAPVHLAGGNLFGYGIDVSGTTSITIPLTASTPTGMGATLTGVTGPATIHYAAQIRRGTTRSALASYAAVTNAPAQLTSGNYYQLSVTNPSPQPGDTYDWFRVFTSGCSAPTSSVGWLGNSTTNSFRDTGQPADGNVPSTSSNKNDTGAANAKYNVIPNFNLAGSHFDPGGLSYEKASDGSQVIIRWTNSAPSGTTLDWMAVRT